MEYEIVSPRSLQALFDELLTRNPDIISHFVPANKVQQRRALTQDEIRNPDHDYAALNGVDFEREYQAINDVGAAILSHPDMNPKHVVAYEQLIGHYRNQLRLMELARDYKAAETNEEKNMLREEYMRLNIELYGEPDEQTYRSFLQEKLEKINKKQLSARGNEIRDELFELTGFHEGNEQHERFKPSDETVEWVRNVAETLYGDMLAHVPSEKEKFNTTETQALFQEIIDEEFGEAAEGWSVDIEEANTVTVKPYKKQVIIPKDRLPISNKKMRGLVVHELGIHMLRSIMGDQTDLAPLGHGLGGYYDAEEGLGAVMEQALGGEFKESGAISYITAGAVYFDGKDFRDLFEMRWRLEVLSSAGDGKAISEIDIAEAKRKAYDGVLRSFRGTDDLPWFKDLAYYNGSVDMWRHLESIRGDDTKFPFVLMGKANPANITHERIQYETATA